MNTIYQIKVNNDEPIEVSEELYEVCSVFNLMLKEKDDEIERLNNNWNELEKWLKSFDKNNDEFNYNFLVVRIQDILNKLKELRGNSNVEN